MASGSVTPFQVGSYFVQQYYNILQESPDYVHQFYTDSSTVTRVVDGDVEEATVSTIMEIHSLLTSLKYTSIEISKLNCQDSWNGGILIVVSGYVKSRNFIGRKKFSQVFFLAPQEKGYFVHNDFFEYMEEEPVDQHQVQEMPNIEVESELQTCVQEEHPSSNFASKEVTSEYVNSMRLDEDDSVDNHSVSDEQQNEDPEPETAVEETPVDESPLPESQVHVVQEDTLAPVDEPVLETNRLTYASILRASKVASGSQPVVKRSMPPLPEQKPIMQICPSQLNPSVSSAVPEPTGVKPEEASTQEEGELTSVYVRNLPSNVTAADLEMEFRNFGRIKPNGIFIRNRKEIGVCFAFVEFEDISSVHVATQASPIQLLDRQVFIEERRASGGNISRGAGRGRGRGRGGYPSDLRGRGVARGRGNGFHI